MRRDDYLGHKCVPAFIEWLRQRVGGDEVFEHSYPMVRPACDWRCGSLWEAHTNYRWRGQDFEANQEKLDGLRSEIVGAVEGNGSDKDKDNERFVDAACGILRWGGVAHHNVQTLRNLGQEALPTLLEASRQLRPCHADTAQLGRVRYMNSGWTKVYALMLGDFPIYDGRVGAAMGYLVQRYCTDEELCVVPELLQFRWHAGKGQHNRNPSVGTLRFRRLSHAGWGRETWAKCNVWAAWVLGEVRSEGRFGGLPACRRLRALEAALFMIGYELPE